MNPVERAAIDRFAGSAEAYCRHLESGPGAAPGRFLLECQRRLLDLHRSALDLPETEPSGGADVPDLASKEAARVVQRGLSPALDRFAQYSHLFDPLESPAEAPVGSDLRLDLTEIYEDVRSGLGAWRHGSPGEKVDAAWEWRFGFVHHWGRHLTDASKAIHWLLFDRFITLDDEVRADDPATGRPNPGMKTDGAARPSASGEAP